RAENLGARGDAVQREILSGAGDRIGRGLDADGPPGATVERVAGEAPGVAEGVQDVPIPGQGSHPQPVLALIQVEPGLVADAHRHVEAHPALVHPDAPGPGVTSPSPGCRESLEAGGRLLVHVKDLELAE